jgi:hypothetical protein
METRTQQHKEKKRTNPAILLTHPVYLRRKIVNNCSSAKNERGSNSCTLLLTGFVISSNLLRHGICNSQQHSPIPNCKRIEDPTSCVCVRWFLFFSFRKKSRDNNTQIEALKIEDDDRTAFAEREDGQRTDETCRQKIYGEHAHAHSNE